MTGFGSAFPTNLLSRLKIASATSLSQFSRFNPRMHTVFPIKLFSNGVNIFLSVILSNGLANFSVGMRSIEPESGAV